MTQELEVVHTGEVVDPEGDLLQACVSEWASASSQALVAKLRQARAAATYIRERRDQGLAAKDAVEEFASEVKAKKSKVYDYTRVWWIYGHLLEDGHSSFSARVESGVLTMSQLVATTRAKDPVEMLDAVEDDNLSSRAIEARIKEEEEPKNVETIEVVICPHCGEKYRMSEAETRTETI